MADESPSASIIGAFVVLILLLVILFSALGELLPELEDAGNSLNQTNQCNNLGGCLFNATNSSTSPCRLEINQTFVCDAGTGEIPLNSLFSFNIIGLLIAAVLIVLVLGAIQLLASKRSK